MCGLYASCMTYKRFERRPWRLEVPEMSLLWIMNIFAPTPLKGLPYRQVTKITGFYGTHGGFHAVLCSEPSVRSASLLPQTSLTICGLDLLKNHYISSPSIEETVVQRKPVLTLLSTYCALNLTTPFSWVLGHFTGGPVDPLLLRSLDSSLPLSFHEVSPLS